MTHYVVYSKRSGNLHHHGTDRNRAISAFEYIKGNQIMDCIELASTEDNEFAIRSQVLPGAFNNEVVVYDLVGGTVMEVW